MKRIVAALFVVAALHVAPARSADEPARATLTIEVTDLRKQQGDLVLGVFNTTKGFPTDDKKSVAWGKKKADAETVVFTAEVPPGDYAASVLHDQNANGRMDKNWLGIPSEGYGVTNNPKPKRRAATFKEATFTVPPEGTTVKISIQYF